jgi:YVTN family beta-propeller protein
MPNTGRLALGLALFIGVGLAGTADAARQRSHETVGFQLFESPQVDPIVLNQAGTRLYVANTTSNQVVVINTATNTVVTTIDVGLDPVSLAIRPDETELWVSNHVSDSVSIVDIAPGGPT